MESAEATEVHALDEKAVDKHLQSVISNAGCVDSSFNAGRDFNTTILGVPRVELESQISLRIAIYTRRISIARLVARGMVRNKIGVITRVTAGHLTTGILARLSRRTTCSFTSAGCTWADGRSSGGKGCAAPPQQHQAVPRQPVIGSPSGTQPPRPLADPLPRRARDSTLHKALADTHA